MSEKDTKGLLRRVVSRIFQIGTVFLSETFILLCFCSRFLLSTPLFWPSALEGPREALAPGHGQNAPGRYGGMAPWGVGALSLCRHGTLGVLAPGGWGD